MTLLLKQQILQLARANPEQEVCGLIAGTGNRFTGIYPVSNVAEDPAVGFLLDPQEQIAAMRDMRHKGQELLGIYHSHPHTTAEPSAADLRLAAYPDVYYVIASLADNRTDIRMYYYDGHSFIQVDN